ncbi:MAG: hypothetical protein ACRD2E_11765 [Terriglobales bacterium]
MGTSRATSVSAANSALARRCVWGVALTSCGSLLLELSLTRLFSVVLFYHFAFMAISIALLGLGAGGLGAFLYFRRYPQRTAAPAAATACAASAGATVLALAVILHADISLTVSWANFFTLAAVYLLAAVPFFGNGFAVSAIIAADPGRVHRLYGADLAGAAAACLALVPLMDALGGPSAILAAAALAGLAAMAFDPRWRRRGLAIAVVLAALAGADSQGRLFDVVYAKGVRRQHILYRRWNSLSRIEVQAEPGQGRTILIDSDAATAIVPFSARQARRDPALAAAYTRVTADAVYAARPGVPALIIGAGGGPDVMRAVLGGSPRVTAVEINPIIVRNLMLGRDRTYSHDLYGHAPVQAVVAEGRNYLRHSRRHYGVVQATMVDTWASTAAGAMALSEANLYTVQAFEEYLRHLTPRGLLSITRWEFRRPREALRVVALGRAALRRGFGVTDPRPYIAVLADDRLDRQGVTVTTLIGRQPLTPGDLARLRHFVAAHPPVQVLYLPGEPHANAFSRLLASRDPAQFAAAYPFDITPPTDDRPFFFYTLKTTAVLRDLLTPGAARAMDFKVNLALFILLSVLVISLAAVIAFLWLPLRWARVALAPGALPDLAYFVALGLGYILLEIAFIQQFVLFLGNPVYALTVVIFVMLAASSLGALWGRHHHACLCMRLVVGGILVLVGLYTWQLAGWLGGWVGLPLVARILVTVALLGPLAFLQGLPFPAGIRWLAASGPEVVAWAWSVNAAASVLGSALAILLAIHFGMRAALAAGGLAYLTVGALTFRFHARHAALVEQDHSAAAVATAHA